MCPMFIPPHAPLPTLPAPTARLDEPPGLQLRLRSWVHTDEVAALSYSPSIRAIVVREGPGGGTVLLARHTGVPW